MLDTHLAGHRFGAGVSVFGLVPGIHAGGITTTFASVPVVARTPTHTHTHIYTYTYTIHIYIHTHTQQTHAHT